MDTPITISSTLSSTIKSAQKNNVSHSDSSILRVPVSLASPEELCERESICTPSTLQKVNNWINSLEQLNQDPSGNINNSYRQCSDFSEYEIEPNIDSGLVNDDSDNDCRTSDYYEHPNCTTTIKYPRNSMCGVRPEKFFYSKANKHYKTLRKMRNKSDESDSDSPLSPDSEKKKELCSYLQLMKPTDKKTVMILQNRRSVRVKNLSLMQEKRELEEKLKKDNFETMNSNHLDNTITDISGNPGLKTFEEINSSLNKKNYEWLKYSRRISQSEIPFYFPKPSNILNKTINHFDETKNLWVEVKKQQEKISECTLSSKVLDEIVSKEKGPNNKEIPLQRSESRKNVINKTKQNSTNSDLSKGKSNLKQTLLPSNTRLLRSTFNSNFNEVKARIKKGKQNIRETYSNKAVGKNKKDVFRLNKSKSRVVQINGGKMKKSIHKTSTLANKESPSIIGEKSVDTISQKKAIAMKNKDNINLKSMNVSLINLKNMDLKVRSEAMRSKVAENNISNDKRQSKRMKSKYNVQRNSFKIKFKSNKSTSNLLDKNKQSYKSKSQLKSVVRHSLRNKTIETSLSKNNSPTSVTRKKQKVNQNVNLAPKNKLKDKDISLKFTENVKKNNLEEPKHNFSDNIVSHQEERSLKISDQKDKKTSNILKDLILDVEYSNLSAEHKSSLLTKDLNQCDTLSHLPIIAIYDKANDKSESNRCLTMNLTKTKEKGEFYSQIINIEKSPEDDNRLDIKNQFNIFKPLHNERTFNIKDNNIDNLVSLEQKDSHFDINNSTRISEKCSTPTSSKQQLDLNPEVIPSCLNESTPFIQFKKDQGIKSLHKCLNILTQKSLPANLEVENSPSSWPSESPSHKRKKSQHSINILKEHGSVLKAFYLEYNLILCQEFSVSFWTQTALGHVLGAQNMWIHKGIIQRMTMNNNCIFKESLEMAVSTEISIAYIELWTKEHQSEIREGPVADVFAIVYFWKKCHSGLDKKVLQLENINGFADDVQYSVLKSTPKIIVSWHLACNEIDNKKTYIHCYQLSHDYQSVSNISEFEAVEHYVSSLHNIEGCDSLIMGCGENKITLWNIDYGYVVATIEMSEIKSPLSTLWVKCDRGFLFTLQQCVDKELRLIAIHGMNHSWKKLASYVPPSEYDRLKGVCVDNGIVLAFYDQGILCWNAQTTETIVEESHNEVEYVSGKYVISVVNDQVYIRHAITHLLSAEDT